MSAAPTADHEVSSSQSAVDPSSAASESSSEAVGNPAAASAVPPATTPSPNTPDPSESSQVGISPATAVSSSTTSEVAASGIASASSLEVGSRPPEPSASNTSPSEEPPSGGENSSPSVIDSGRDHSADVATDNVTVTIDQVAPCPSSESLLLANGLTKKESSVDASPTEMPSPAKDELPSQTPLVGDQKSEPIAPSLPLKGGISLSGDGFILIIFAFIAMSVMFVEIVILPSLPEIAQQDGFKQDASWISWVLASYNLVGAISTPIFSGLGDLYGRKKMMIICLCIYGCGLILGGFSMNMMWLLASRAIMGVGMATFPLAFAIIRQTFQPRLIPMAIGIVSAMFSIGVSLGFIGGGALLLVMKWNEIFFVIAPIVAIATLLIAWRINAPHVKPPPGTSIDFGGCGLLTVGLLCFLIPLSQASVWGWKSPETLTPIVLSPFILVGFVFYELKQGRPLVDIRLMSRRNVFVVNMVMLCFGFGMFMLFQSLPFFIANPKKFGGFGKSKPIDIGILMVSASVTQLICAPIVAKLIRIIGPGVTLSTGTFLAALCYALFVPFHATETDIIALNAFSGVGLTFTMVSNINVMAQGTSQQEFSIAAGMNALFRILGGSVGPCVSQAIMDANKQKWRPSPYAPEREFTTEEGFMWVWGVAAMGVFLSHLLSLSVRGLFDSCKRLLERKSGMSKESQLPLQPVVGGE